MNTKEQSPGTGQNHAGENKTICFDVDGTLRNYNDEPRTEVIDVLKLYVRAGWRVCVWSGGGRDYASRVGNMLKLPASIGYHSKHAWPKLVPDIAVDDQDVNLGERNVFVGKREVW